MSWLLENLSSVTLRKAKLNSIVTGDDTVHFTPQNKKTVPRVATFQFTKETQVQVDTSQQEKIIATVFWDRNGELLVDFIREQGPQSTTYNVTVSL